MRTTDIRQGKKNLTKGEFIKLFEKTKREMAMLSDITNEIMRSLEMDQVIYTILTALTSSQGLGFDRAMFFMVNDEGDMLEGKMAMGPHSAKEARDMWRLMENGQMSLSSQLAAYGRFKKEPDSKLNSIVKDIALPLREDMGILPLTILEGMPFQISTEEAMSMVNDGLKELLNMDLFVSVPFKTRDKTLGAILVDNIFSGTLITEDKVHILNIFADHAALAIENSLLYEKTVHLSQTDWLTGLWNARQFNTVLDEKIERAIEQETGLSLLIADIDNFKKYNDTLGHQEGDKAIKRVANILDGQSRGSDLVCRYGGEEFCIVMARTGKKDAEMIAERLRREVEKSFSCDTNIAEDIKLTISIGISAFPCDSNEKEGLIRKADLALYRAKKTGKNRTCVYSSGIEGKKNPQDK